MCSMRPRSLYLLSTRSGTTKRNFMGLSGDLNETTCPGALEKEDSDGIKQHTNYGKILMCIDTESSLHSKALFKIENCLWIPKVFLQFIAIW